MNKIQIIALFIFLPFWAGAQAQLKGNVKNNGTPIGWANVVLSDLQGKIASGTLTKEDGSFELQLKPGSYQIKISFLGFDTWEREMLLDKNTDLGIVQLKEQQGKLNEVVIVAKKKMIEYKADRLVFNVEGNISATGGNAVNALSAAPGVMVQNGAISLLGKGASRVMINGRLLELSGAELISYLNAIAASDIKSIEVITNPPAKYEAAGDGGLINIILKKGMQDSWKNTSNLAYDQATYGFLSLRNSFFYNKNRVRFSVNGGGTLGYQKSKETLDAYYPKGNWELQTAGKQKQDNAATGVAFDYDLSSRTSIGVQYQGNFNNPDRTDYTQTQIYNASHQIDSLLINTANNDLYNRSHAYNAHLVSKLDTQERKLSIDVDHFTYSSGIDNNFVAKTYLPDGSFLNVNQAANNASTRHIANTSLKVDVEHPLQFINLSYGAKASFIKSNAAIQYFNTMGNSPVLDPSRSNVFEYRENNQAFYVSGTKQVNGKLSLQLGLRLENTQTEGYSATLGQKNTNDYVKLFPTFYLSYKATANHSWLFNYGRRINRPSFANLNPFRSYINSKSYSEGNPFLRPSFNDNFDLSLVYKGKLRTNVFFNVTTDGYGVIFSSDPQTNTQIISRENYFREYYYGIGENYSASIAPWWQSENLVYLLGSKTKFVNGINAVPANNVQLYLNSNHSFSLGKTTKLQADAFYTSRVRRGLYEVGDMFGLNLGIRQDLLNGKLQVAALANDIFNTAYLKDYASVVNGIKQVYSENSSNRFFRLSLTYSFGNNKMEAKNRSFGNDEERRRSN